MHRRLLFFVFLILPVVMTIAGVVPRSPGDNDQSNSSNEDNHGGGGGEESMDHDRDNGDCNTADLNCGNNTTVETDTLGSSTLDPDHRQSGTLSPTLDPDHGPTNAASSGASSSLSTLDPDHQGTGTTVQNSIFESPSSTLDPDHGQGGVPTPTPFITPVSQASSPFFTPTGGITKVPLASTFSAGAKNSVPVLYVWVILPIFGWYAIYSIS